MRKVLKLLPIVFIILLYACATQLPNLHEMEPKDLSALAMKTYTEQFKYHEAKSQSQFLSNREKQDLNSLKEDLVEVKPIIDAYDMAVSMNVSSNPTDRLAIILFLERILY